jgi:hypothetical protein
MQMNYNVTRTSKFFKHLDAVATFDLLNEMDRIVFMPGDCIINEGELDRQLYILLKGSVQVTKYNPQLDEDVPLAMMHRDCVFGETGLLGLPRTASVTCVTYCDTLALGQESFMMILRQQPNFTSLFDSLTRTPGLMRQGTQPTADEGNSSPAKNANREMEHILQNIKPIDSPKVQADTQKDKFSSSPLLGNRTSSDLNALNDAPRAQSRKVTTAASANGRRSVLFKRSDMGTTRNPRSNRGPNGMRIVPAENSPQHASNSPIGNASADASNSATRSSGNSDSEVATLVRECNSEQIAE